MQIPDAPWIRSAEINGYPESDPVYCPICGQECDTIYFDKYGNLFACDSCLRRQDSWEWAEDEREANRPDRKEVND